MKLTEEQFKTLVWERIDYLLREEEPEETYEFNVEKIVNAIDKESWVVTIENNGYTVVIPLIIDEESDMEYIDIYTNMAFLFVVNTYSILDCGDNGNIVFEIAARLNMFPHSYNVDRVGTYVALHPRVGFNQIKVYEFCDKIEVLLKYPPYSYKKTIYISKDISAKEQADKIIHEMNKMEELK